MDNSRQGSGQGLLRRTRKTRASACSPDACLEARADKTENIDVGSILDSIERQDALPAIPKQSLVEAEAPRLGSPLFARDDDKPRGPPINQDREHLLIAAGAIGAFILFCFLGWIIYRVLKKSGKLGGPPAVPFEASPWGMRNGKFSQYPPSEPPSMYDKAEMGYGADKMYARSSYAYSGGGTLRRQAPGIPVNGQFTGQGNGLPRNADDRAIDQYYNELFASQPPASARDPAQRQYRMSDVSSLSSGFGDGDFIVTQPLPAPPRAATSQPSAPSQRGSAAYSRPPSWTSQPESRRETVYTTTSEDRPARFRTLSSWVNQQSGRVKRADSRAQERGEIPVMPAIPGEMSFIRQTTYR
ncbi:uncharacterized protein B0I36DRAFT_359546 [Microdochium trichocladiopsis]|uniref:Uncharacterized protein n=1 Tax=Microdochium trichocladiopsis TaxID=1682393 RepID=A0A9P9BSH8_9PEZI|nr:uncharacterized protein B0I36DRAFT_359546 [Microdochium trichocladiopsis]KAH7037915.1 hypothetical protein B0I36DRAFT_359546 [Microdochium trichocladiopsis]